MPRPSLCWLCEPCNHLWDFLFPLPSLGLDPSVSRVYFSDHCTHGFYVSNQIKVDSPSFRCSKSHIVCFWWKKCFQKEKQPWASLGLIAKSLVLPVTIFSATGRQSGFIKHLIAVDSSLLLCGIKQNINSTFITSHYHTVDSYSVKAVVTELEPAS